MVFLLLIIDEAANRLFGIGMGMGMGMGRGKTIGYGTRTVGGGTK